MKLTPVALPAKDHQFFSFKRMVGANNGDGFWQVLVMGSVSWGRLTRFSTLYCWTRWRGESEMIR